MSVSLGSNILSLTTQRHLAQAQRQGAVATERLSSGLRINSSGDDAAGIAVAARLGVRASGLGIGLRNVNEAVSLLQVTETAIDDASRGLMRLRELALQSANGGNGPSDRSALQQEAAQILEEIRRLASQTSYRGERLLDGRAGTLGVPARLGSRRTGPAGRHAGSQDRGAGQRHPGTRRQLDGSGIGASTRHAGL